MEKFFIVSVKVKTIHMNVKTIIMKCNVNTYLKKNKAHINEKIDNERCAVT